MITVPFVERLMERRKHHHGRRYALAAGAGVAAGATLMYFLDPDRGRSRRAMTVQRTGGVARSAAQDVEGVGRGVAARAVGLKDRVVNLGPDEIPANDAALAAKVESEIFAGLDVTPGRVNINAEDGVVVLRGQIDDPKIIEKLEKRTRKIRGVRGVNNLLHLPGQVPENKAPVLGRDHR